jgi:hypothetical protein
MTATLQLQLTEETKNPTDASFLQLWRADDTGKLEVIVGFYHETQSITLTREQESQLKLALDSR